MRPSVQDRERLHQGRLDMAALGAVLGELCVFGVVISPNLYQNVR